MTFLLYLAICVAITLTTLLLDVAIKQQMQKDIDEAGKIARLTKSKLEELDQDVWLPNMPDAKRTSNKYINFREPYI